ncbi:MAG TPA: hypothetical protein VGB98_15040 [Pyrinomonadaceae bacterium]|jgi:hypothetical protein
MNDADLWRFLPAGYLFTVALETPVLWLLLSPRHARRRRLFAGLWLTACTYPVVVLVLPPLFADSTRAAYLLVAEIFAPAAECALFWLAFGREKTAAGSSTLRDFAAITAANLLSFLAGEAAAAYSWFGLFG